MLDDARWPAASALIDDACGITGNDLMVGEGSKDDIRALFIGSYYRGQRREDLEREYLKDYQSYRRTRAALSAAARRSSGARHRPVHGRGAEDLAHLQRDAAPGRLPGRLERAARRARRFPHHLGPRRPRHSDGWGSSRVAMVTGLLPHIRQFVRVRQALVRAEARNTTVTALLDNPRIGVLHLDRRGRIMAANDRARSILRRGDGLSDRDGMLHARAPADQVRLERLLGDALPASGTASVSGSMLLRRSPVLPPFVVHVKPGGGVAEPRGPERAEPGPSRSWRKSTSRDHRVEACSRATSSDSRPRRRGCGEDGGQGPPPRTAAPSPGRARRRSAGSRRGSGSVRSPATSRPRQRPGVEASRRRSAPESARRVFGLMEASARLELGRGRADRGEGVPSSLTTAGNRSTAGGCSGESAAAARRRARAAHRGAVRDGGAGRRAGGDGGGPLEGELVRPRQPPLHHRGPESPWQTRRPPLDRRNSPARPRPIHAVSDAPSAIDKLCSTGGPSTSCRAEDHEARLDRHPLPSSHTGCRSTRRNGTRWRHCSRAEAALRAHDRGQRLDGGLLPERRDEAPYACITSREAMVIDQVLPDGHGVAPPGRRPRRSARGRARRRSPAARGWGGPRTPARRHPCPCRPTVPAKSRWTLPTKWPVLPDARKAGHGPAPPRRPPSGSRWPSRGGPRWPVRSAAATTPGVPGPRPAVVCLQPRRCSCRAGTRSSRPASTSRAAIGNGRFSTVHQWPDWSVHRGPPQVDGPNAAFLPAAFLHGFDAAELHSRTARRLQWGDPGAQQIVCLRVQMKPHFLVERGLEALAVEQRSHEGTQAREQGLHLF